MYMNTMCFCTQTKPKQAHITTHQRRRQQQHFQFLKIHAQAPRQAIAN